MSYFITFKIDKINGIFSIPIEPGDDVKYACNRIQKEFGIIPALKAKMYGSDLESSSLLSQCVRSQDVITFEAKETDKGTPNIEFYRKPIIIPRYQSSSTFIVFSTVNFQSLTTGNKVHIDIERDSLTDIQLKVKDMINKNYKQNIDASKILLYLPGGIPFLKGTIKDFTESFPDFMPHLYAVVNNNSKITDQVLNEIFDTVCNVSTDKMQALISPDATRDKEGLCEMAAALGYVQQNGQNVKRMIYSIAKYVPFAPLINGLYNLACLSRINGRTLLQITAPLSIIFKEMNKVGKVPNNKLFSSTVKFLTFFMNVKISDRIPCTEFIRPFYEIGYEKYFHDCYENDEFAKITSIVAFDPDFRDQDWIRFELPTITQDDFENAMRHSNMLKIIPPMSLREIHRVALFSGNNGPCLFLAASVSKEETEKEKVDYIDPANGTIQHDTYQNIAVMSIGIDYKTKGAEFDKKVTSTIDPEKVSQLVVICIDKSGSMILPFDKNLMDDFYKRKLVYGKYEDRFSVSQKFFTRFTQISYRFHTNSLYGSIMFNHSTDLRNELNPLVDNFNERMIHRGESPAGGTRMFTAMNLAATKLLEAKQKNKYPNAVLRIIVISDGEDGCGPSEMASVMNRLIENKIRVDGIIVSDEIAKELVEISRATGGFSIFPQTIEEGYELFNKEEFFNVNIRQFGPFKPADYTQQKVSSLRQLTVADLDKEIAIKPNKYADANVVVATPKYVIWHSDQQKPVADPKASKSHNSTKRLVNELRKIVTNNDEDLLVFPLKDHIDVWRVLIKGTILSPYQDKWYYMIVEFPEEYPNQYPSFRFVYAPFHPNISDQGRICLDTLDQNYRSDKPVSDLIGEIRQLLMDPNFDSPIDNKRASFKGKPEEFKREIEKYDKKAAKKSPEEWKSAWKIEPEGEIPKDLELCPTVPEFFLCPITRKIMKEPVKASSGVFYEKVALEKYINSTQTPTCRRKLNDKKQPIPLPRDKNLNLPVDNEMKTRIANWIKENNYKEEDEEGDELENIVDFKSNNRPISQPDYKTEMIDTANNQNSNNNKDAGRRTTSVPRYALNEK